MGHATAASTSPDETFNVFVARFVGGIRFECRANASETLLGAKVAPRPRQLTQLITLVAGRRATPS